MNNTSELALKIVKFTAINECDQDPYTISKPIEQIKASGGTIKFLNIFSCYPPNAGGNSYPDKIMAFNPFI